MKKLILICGVVVLAQAVQGQQPVPPAASPAEIAAGSDRFKYVTPYSLATSGVASNGVTAAGVTNIVNGISLPAANLSGTVADARIASTIARSRTNGIVYVATNGVDTAGAGRMDSPFRTLTYALSNLGSAREIHLGVGSWTESNLNLTNLFLRGEDRENTVLIYSNTAYAWMTWTNVVIQNLTIRPNFTNSALTYPLVTKTGSLIVRDVNAYGQSDIFFPVPVSQTESLYLESDNMKLYPSWDAFNLVNCHRSTRVIIKNPNCDFANNFSGFPRRFVAGINGHSVTLIGGSIFNSIGDTADTMFSGTDLANLRVIATAFTNSGPFLASYDYHDGPELLAVSFNGGALPDRYKTGELRPSYTRHTSPWLNSVNIYATNKSEAYRGQTLVVSGSGTTAANGKYVLAADNGVFDDTWSFTQRTWTNTANQRLIIVRADTNEVTYLNVYQLFTNGAASLTAPSTSWTLIAHAETWDGTWTRDSGPAGNPVVTNYYPALTLYVDGRADFSNGVAVAGSKIQMNADGGFFCAGGSAQIDTLGNYVTSGGLYIYNDGTIEGPGLAYEISSGGRATFSSVSGDGSDLVNLSKLLIQTNGTAVTPNCSLYLTNQNGQVFRISAQSL